MNKDNYVLNRIAKKNDFQFDKIKYYYLDKEKIFKVGEIRRGLWQW